MADEPEGPKQPEEPPPTRPTIEDLRTAMGDVNYFRNIDAFVQIRSESYLAQSAILEVQFTGRGGDIDKARREFMTRAMDVFDKIATDYQDRSFIINTQRRREIMLARQRAAAAPPPTDPEPTAG